MKFTHYPYRMYTSDDDVSLHESVIVHRPDYVIVMYSLDYNRFLLDLDKTNYHWAIDYDHHELYAKEPLNVSC